MMPTEIITLNHGASQVLLCPGIGAALARYSWRGHSVLRPAPDAAIAQGLVRQMGAYPLVPYSNRIAQAQLLAGNTSYALRPNFAPEPHAIHGFGWQHAWQISLVESDFAQLTLKHTPDEDWPFACETVQNVRLMKDALEWSLSVCNLDERPMPAGLGFHPYFPLTPALRLQTEWTGMWQQGVDALPTALVPVPAAADFRKLRPVQGLKVDNCFVGWERHALLDYGAYRLTLDASSDCGQVVCFAPDDGRNFVALEPVSHVNNAFALAARGVPDTGMRTLKQGDALEISMTLRLAGDTAIRQHSDA